MANIGNVVRHAAWRQSRGGAKCGAAVCNPRRRGTCARSRTQEGNMNTFSKKFFLAAIVLGGAVCSIPSWAQQSLKAAGRDFPPWVVHDKNSNALSGIF